MSEFAWVCDKNLASSLITSLGMAGKFFGAMIAGWYADRFGRKNCLIGTDVTRLSVSRLLHHFSFHHSTFDFYRDNGSRSERVGLYRHANTDNVRWGV